MDARTRPSLQPLKLSCDTAACEEGLHCFRETKKRAKQKGHGRGSCQECGATLLDWERIQRRDHTDVAHTVASLKQEWIRHHYWHARIDQKAVNSALRKGKVGLRESVPKRIRSSVGVKHSHDGRQTPWEGNIHYYAQHATACCCRRCMEYWHGIPQEIPLTDEHIAYFSELCLLYLFERLPTLPEIGIYVPPIPAEASAPVAD